MFYANWCPHCTAMVDTWTALHEKYGIKYGIHAIDCAEEANKEVCSKFGVTGFPTIKVWNQGQLTDYQGGRDIASLERTLLSLPKGKIVPPRMVMTGGGSRRRTSTRRRSLVKCTGKKSDKKPCKRNALPGKKRCWQHSSH
jgi:glutaredoxin